MYSYRPQRRGPRAKPREARALQGYVLPREGERRPPLPLRQRRLLLAVVALAAVVGVIALYKSPLLRVQAVEVVGTAKVDRQAVLDLASLEGESMFNPPLERTEDRIAAALPLVKAVKAERRWPNSIRIEVVERQPWGYWQVGDEAHVVDSEGVVLAQVKPPEGAPTIFDRTSDRGLAAGDRVDAATIGLAVRLAEAVPKRLGLQISRFEFDDASGLTAVTSTDYRVVMGDAQNFEYKLAVWKSLEQKLGREAMTGHVLDLRFDGRPSFR
ncbi:MAG: cell division protein FtsQ/DivIB [Dehalococcoidia bacterium]